MSALARLFYTKRAAAEDIAKQAVLDMESIGEKQTVLRLKGLKMDDPKLFNMVMQELTKLGHPVSVPG